MDLDKTALGVMDADEKTQAISMPSGNATQMAMNVECPVCRTANPPSETYCIDCGFLLSGAPVMAAETPEQPSVGKLITPDGTREFPLNPGANTVGRENADILLSHNTISRKHATITVEDGKAFAEDVGSTNGTYVDGKKLTPDEKAELKDGCDVVFGSFSLKYEAPAEVVEQSAGSADTPSPGGEGGGEGAPVPDETTEMIQPVQEPTEEGEEVPEAEASVEEPVEAVPAVVGRLVAKDGSCSLDIQEGTNTVGRRAGDNDIVVPDPYCSGRHADLVYEDGKFTITDIGSTNGTVVNGAKLDPNSPRELADGDEITLGRMAFTLEVV